MIRLLSFFRFLPLSLALGLMVSAYVHADEAIRSRLEAIQTGHSVVFDNRPLVMAEGLNIVYSERNHELLWFQENGTPKESVETLLAAIADAQHQGLRPEDYHQQTIKQRLEQLEAGEAPEFASQDLDMLLSDALLLLATDLQHGKTDPHVIDPQWTGDSRSLQWLQDSLETFGGKLTSEQVSALLYARAPQTSGYRKLVEARRELAARIEDSQWPPIPAGPLMRAGEDDPRMVLVEERLRFWGDLSDEITLDAAIRSFQKRHGLAADGVIGPQTLAMLNFTPRQRLDRIDANLERWRWMPADLGSPHVLVNIAGFEVQLVDDGEVTWRRPAVVGRDYRRTPVFSDRIRYLVLNPDWVVPPRLAAQDKLPEIRRDPEYLARLGYRVYDGWGQDRQVIDPASVDWNSVSSRAFPYRLVQEPGPLNALGRVKFMFPNPYNVYLHDTSSPELFSQPERAFSSGCVRIKDPLDLAALLLQREGWPRHRLDSAIASGRLQTVYLRNPVPVHIQYWNAWVDDDGVLQIRRDIYQRDQPILTALRSEQPS